MSSSVSCSEVNKGKRWTGREVLAVILNREEPPRHPVSRALSEVREGTFQAEAKVLREPQVVGPVNAESC